MLYLVYEFVKRFIKGVHTVVYKALLPRTFVQKYVCVYEYDVFQPCKIFCTSYTCTTYKSTRSLHSDELIVVFSSKSSFAHWSSYTKLVLYCVRQFGQIFFGPFTKVRTRSKSKSYTYFCTRTTSYISTTVWTNLNDQSCWRQGLLYHRACKSYFLCNWPSLNSYLK